MANNDNLKVPTSEEARELGRKGGQASGRARKRRKELKELLIIALSQPCKDADMDNWAAVTAALVQKALGGDTKAFEVIRDTIGQKPIDKVSAELSSCVDINITVKE